MFKLIDKFGRKINYLRLSVTEHCNYRCFYCRDNKYTPYCKREDILSYGDIERIIQLFAQLGITKVRLTGGEPLLRKDIYKIAKIISHIDGINDVPLSTNAHLLEKFAKKLYQNGINRVNISMDTLIHKKFEKITRGGDLTEVIKGIDAAIQVNMRPIKINMVTMRGVNDNEIESMIDFAINKGIDIRFIETMPIGSTGIEILTQYISEKKILTKINNHLNNKLVPIASSDVDGPAHNFKIMGTNSTIGIISAMSNNFCQTCNRVRLTAKGDLILCLGQKNSISLKDALHSNLTDDQIKNIIINAINKKPEKHEFNSVVDNISNRQMVEIGG
ncbi:MAG: GTP 3',8-cyclase MoaA [Candidatus Vesicomyosocius endoextente]|uniref:GTP 3',8-cyclase n=1 Tax=Candidatus Vesicomyosocius endoextente TaxID=2738853 RepID=A0A853G719_9GAMM|nr:GTP 3',8-cyclase MoaA [Candidatus Vesicomyosocius endoextente]